MTLQLVILFTSCSIYIYLNYKFVPLIKKLKEEEPDYKKLKKRNVFISISYFTWAIFILILFLTPTQYETRLRIIDTMTGINHQVLRLEALIDSDTDKIGDDLMNIRNEIAKLQYGYKMRYSLNEYIDCHMVEGLNLVLNQYDTNHGLSEQDLIYIRNIVELNINSERLMAKSTYNLGLNPFKKLKMKDSVKLYQNKMAEYYTSYKSAVTN